MTAPRTTPINLIGLPTDQHSSHLRGPALGPAAVRRMLWSEMGNPASEDGSELGAEIDLRDLGDLDLAEDAGDDGRITAAITASLRAGRIPLSLGGDHSVTYPILAAIAGHHGPVEILHIDAHPDLYDSLNGDRRSHASPFARIMEDGLASRLVQLGIRTLNRHQREQAARFGVECHEMRHHRTAALPSFTRPLYISIDLDGFDPAFAPGVSHHEPGGLSVRDVVDLLHTLNVPLVGADIVELNPARDINDMTATLAAKLVKEVCAGAHRWERQAGQ